MKVAKESLLSVMKVEEEEEEKEEEEEEDLIGTFGFAAARGAASTSRLRPTECAEYFKWSLTGPKDARAGPSRFLGPFKGLRVFGGGIFLYIFFQVLRLIGRKNI